MAHVGSGRLLKKPTFYEKLVVFRAYWILELWVRKHGLVPIHFLGFFQGLKKKNKAKQLS